MAPSPASTRPNGTDIPALIADSAAGTGVEGRGEGRTQTHQHHNAGGKFVGSNGVYGQTDVGFGTGVLAQANASLNWALRATGFTFLDGDLCITGTCSGCTAAMMAVNGSGSTLKQGDAVALDGVTQDKDGSIVLVVRAAKKNDAVIGVVDREMKAAPDSIKVGGEKRTIKVNGKSRKGDHDADRTVKLRRPCGARRHLRRCRQVPAHHHQWRVRLRGRGPGRCRHRRCVAVGTTTGKLGKANAESSAKAGRYLASSRMAASS